MPTTSSLTLGIHIGHDGGTAVARDGEILVACAEERLTRVKYANGWWNSLRYCLGAFGLLLDDFDLIVFSNAGPPLPTGFDAGLASWSTKPLRTVNVDHHLSHAVGAFCFSGFDEALVYVGDAGGNDDVTESAFSFSREHFDCTLRSERGRPRHQGLGTTYEAFTNFLGFRDQESGKTMALAAFGDPMSWRQPLFRVFSDGSIQSALDAPHYWGVSEFDRRYRLGFGNPFPPSSEKVARDIAAYLQGQFCETLVSSLQVLRRKAPSPNLVLTGGIALNCVANSAVRSEFCGSGFFPFPAASDTGLPIGNAFYGQWLLGRKFPKPVDRSMLFGRHYTDGEIRAALARQPSTVPPGAIRKGELRFSRREDIIGVAADLIASGKVIGWWQGRSETGPRALGSRSILASAGMRGVRDRINTKVKRREWFRPFGPSVLQLQGAEYASPNLPYPYMIEAPKATALGRRVLAECVHHDGTARLQTVDTSTNERFVLLLHALCKRTGSGAVLNTSFNNHEPIVETPGEAIATFLRTDLDALILDDYVCTRWLPSPSGLDP